MSTDTVPGSNSLVSIICRTTGRRELQEALQSVACQTHPNLELLLVDAACKDLNEASTWSGPVQCKIVSPGNPLPRAKAANAGLDAAQGEYIIFLDEDDWIASEHIASLLSELESNPDIDATYSNTQLTTADGKLLNTVFAQDFDRRVLMHDNYIAIHSLLFRRSILNKGCRFDENFDDFEDWDFWLQLARHTDFLHLNITTAFYRQGGGSTTATSNDEDKYLPDKATAAGRAKLFEKWLGIWTGNEYNQMLGEIFSEISNLQRQVILMNSDISNLQRQMILLNSDIDKRSRTQETLQNQLALKNDEYQKLIALHEDLDNAVRRMLNSTSWRITGPLRFVSRKVRQHLPGGSKKKLKGKFTQGFEANQNNSSSPNIKFELDSFSNGKILCVEELLIQGWAISDSGPVSFDVHIDGLLFKSSRTSKYRPDVYRKNRHLEHSMYAGFDEGIDLASLNAGKHRVEVSFSTESSGKVSESTTFYKLSANHMFNAWSRFHFAEQSRDKNRSVRKLACLSKHPITIILNCGTDKEKLTKSLSALAQQSWDEFHLVTLNANGEFAEKLIRKYPKLASRITVLDDAPPDPEKQSYALALNAGETLQPYALQMLYLRALESGSQLVYSDHDQVDSDGHHSNPVFTWSWSPDLLYSVNYVGGVYLGKQSMFLQLDWAKENFCALRYAILLRLSLEAARIERIPNILWSEPELSENRGYARQEFEVIRQFLDSNSLPAKASEQDGIRSLKWELQGNPLVSIIMPTLGKLSLLKPCIESLQTLTTYKNFEVIILNNGRGENQDGFDYLAKQNFKIVECDEPFNWARLNNIGAQHAKGEHLLFLNDDIEIIQEDWLQELVSLSQRKETGAIGCKLLYPAGALQHAGIFLINYGGGGLHLFHKLKPKDGHYMELDQRVREVSANTGACLMVSRKKFDGIDGFDEELKIVGNDIDFCLRLRKNGLRNLWTSRCTLIHHESISREPRGNDADENYLWKRWRWLFESGDPHYNPNLSLHTVNCSLIFDVPVKELIAAIPEDLKADYSNKPLIPRNGVNLIGYIRANMGLGEAARADARALKAANIDFGIINFEHGNPASMTNYDWLDFESSRPDYDINLIHINGDFIPLMYSELPSYFFQARYNIAFWAWELETLPQHWLGSLEFLDEIWVPSEFVKDAVAKETQLPVTVIGHNVALSPDSEIGRDNFGIPQSAFVFLAMYDTRSIAERKNTKATVQAFQRAFSALDKSVCLVLKMNNPAKTDLAALQKNLEGWSNIFILDRHHSRNEIDSLINCTDCYVSLHRSEGFGLGPAEAMSVGKPCILTNWSGNTDYMTEDNCLAVDYELVNLEVDYGPYNAGQRWADADVQQASEYMKKLVDNPQLAKRIGDSAKNFIDTNFSPAAIGKQILERLSEIRKAEKPLAP